MFIVTKYLPSRVYIPGIVNRFIHTYFKLLALSVAVNRLGRILFYQFSLNIVTRVMVWHTCLKCKVLHIVIYNIEIPKKHCDWKHKLENDIMSMI